MKKESIIYTNETNCQEFISKSFMREKLYSRLVVHAGELEAAMYEFLSNDDFLASNFQLYVDELHVRMTGYIHAFRDCGIIDFCEAKKLRAIIFDLSIDIRLCRYNDECREGIRKLFDFLL